MNRTHSKRSHSALWASAFVIAALVIAQAGRMPAAQAETVVSVNDYVALTARTGRGPDERPNEALFVLDNREQTLVVYDMEDAQRGTLVVRGGGSLVNLFRNARGR
jgi:hypothetical protein